VIILNPIAFNYSLRGGVYMKAGKVDKAIKDYSKAIMLEPNQMDLYRSRAYCYSLINQNSLSIKDYNTALELAPDEINLFLYRAQSFEDNQDYEKAIIDYNMVIDKDPKEIEAYIGKGICQSVDKQRYFCFLGMKLISYKNENNRFIKLFDFESTDFQIKLEFQGDSLIFCKYNFRTEDIITENRIRFDLKKCSVLNSD